MPLMAHPEAVEDWLRRLPTIFGRKPVTAGGSWVVEVASSTQVLGSVLHRGEGHAFFIGLGGTGSPAVKCARDIVDASGALGEEPLYVRFLGLEAPAATSPIPSLVSRRASHLEEVTLESERLKSQLIAAHREVLSARRNAEYLEAQNEQQLGVISALAEANRSLQKALIAKAEGRVCLHEARKGVVTDQEGNELALEFDTAEGPLEQTYGVSQFIAGRVPRVGDELEAYVIVTWRGKGPSAPPPRAADVERKEDEFPGFRTKGVTGPIEL